MRRHASSNESLLIAAEQLIQLEQELVGEGITSSERRSLELAIIELQQLIRIHCC
jgi:hypothetical protein